MRNAQRITGNVRGFAKVGRDILSLTWPLKTRLVKAKLLKFGQKSYSRWAGFVAQLLQSLLLAVDARQFQIFDWHRKKLHIVQHSRLLYFYLDLHS